MPLIQSFLRFLDAQGNVPNYFGAFHLAFITLTIIASVVLCILWKKEKIVNIDKILLITSVVLLILGIYKQIVLSVVYEPEIGLVYDWDNFPWNFLSIPLLIGIFAGLTPNKISKFFLSYYATFGMLTGLWGMFKPDAFGTTIGVNVYNMLCYATFISFSVLFLYSKNVKVEIKTFIKALPVFASIIAVAIAFNEIGHLVSPLHKISLLEISRHDLSITPVYSNLHNLFYSSGNIVSGIEFVYCILFYFTLVSAFAIIPMLLIMIVRKLLEDDFKMSFERRDAIALGVRKSEGLDVESTQDIFKFEGKVNSGENTYRTTYFNNLHTNLGNNAKNSCGYVAASMLLSYYDTVLSDKIVPREFEKSTMSHNYPDFSESPGSKFYQFAFNPDEMRYRDYVNVINKAKSSYLHECLVNIAMDKNLTNEPEDKEVSEFNFNASVDDIESVIKHYLKKIADVRASEFDINTKDNSQEIEKALRFGNVSNVSKYSAEIRKYVIKKIKHGYPVLLGIYNGKDGHAVIAYDYDKKEDKIYCHFGKSTDFVDGQRISYTHLTPEEKGYDTYVSALVLDFDEDKISHTHTNNYEVVVNGAIFYYCPDGRYTTCDDLLVEFGNGKTELAITGVYSRYAKDQLTIPEYYGNVKVSAISDHAFENQEHITRVVISASIPVIPKKAFEDCESLTTVVIPSSVTKIGKEAFAECSKLTNIVYLGTREQWHNINKSSSWDRKTGNYTVRCLDGILIKLHAEGHGDLRENNIKMPVMNLDEKYFDYQNVKPEYYEAARARSIGKCEFDKKGRLTRVVISDKISEITKKTFEDCDVLTSVVMPKTVEKIGSDAFADCKNLTTINYHGTIEEWFNIKKKSSWDNKTGKYKVVCLNGTLTKSQANGKNDYCEPKLEPVEMKDSKEKSKKSKNSSTVKYPELATYAFDKKGNVTHAIISSGVTKIPKEAFDDCELLSTVIIPASVETISKDAFEDCSKLENIIYLGMKEEWQAIDKKDDWDEDTGDYTIVCLNGILKKNYYEAESDDVDAPLLPMDVIAAGYLIYDEKIFKKFDIEKCKKYINRLSTSVKITKIPRNQFKDWTSLQSVTIGGNVNKISSGAFENCSSLNEFLYLGTKSQWLAIKKDSSWDKNTGNYTVMCSDGDLTKSQAQQTPIK